MSRSAGHLNYNVSQLNFVPPLHSCHLSPAPLNSPIDFLKIYCILKEIIIELYNEAGQLAKAWRVYRCWPSEYVALSELDANGASVAFEMLTLQHEGWERDDEVKEPVEPKYNDPPG